MSAFLLKYQLSFKLSKKIIFGCFVLILFIITSSCHKDLTKEITASDFREQYIGNYMCKSTYSGAYPDSTGNLIAFSNTSLNVVIEIEKEGDSALQISVPGEVYTANLISPDTFSVERGSILFFNASDSIYMNMHLSPSRSVQYDGTKN